MKAFEKHEVDAMIESAMFVKARIACKDRIVVIARKIKRSVYALNFRFEVNRVYSVGEVCKDESGEFEILAIVG